MQYICIMGNNAEHSANINNRLVQMGYKDNPIWSTRKTNYTEVLSEDSYDKAIRENKIVHLETKDDIKYGILKPIGSKKYVTYTSIQQFNRIKEIYKEQVYGFYISYDKDITKFELSNQDLDVLRSNSYNVIVYNHKLDINNIVAEILKATKV